MMQWYVIDELSRQDCLKIQGRLHEMGLAGGIDGLFWLPLPQSMLNQIQSEHTESCGPHALALELDCASAHNDFDHAYGASPACSLRLELLVRATGTIRCDCICKASIRVREYMLGYLDNMLVELGVEF